MRAPNVKAVRWAALALSACLFASTCAEVSPGLPHEAAAQPAPLHPPRPAAPPVLVTAQELAGPPARPAILIFSRTRGYRHEDAIPAANAMFAEIAARRGWSVVFSEDETIANPRQLAWFDAVVFNNTSGTLFREPPQRDALRAYIERGGGFVGVHGAGGDPSYLWLWYVYELLGSRFTGHPTGPLQFQQATIHVEDRTQPATRHLPEHWVRTDEWYSFANAARRPGFRVLATLDENTYTPDRMSGRDLRMGADHPIMWQHCEGRGRVFYSALGHRASAYAEPEYAQTLEGAVAWAARLDGEGCG